jgi:GAF domain-containing protein
MEWDTGDERERLVAREGAAWDEYAALKRSAWVTAEVSRVLAGSLDYDATLHGLAQIAVPAVADYCILEVGDEDAHARRVAVAHADPLKEAALLESRRRRMAGANESSRAPRSERRAPTEIAAGRPEPISASDARAAKSSRRRPEADRESSMILPLAARGRALGTLTLVSTRPHHRYGPTDLAFGEQLADLVALAVDNAWLRRRAQREEARREALQRLARRCATESDPSQLLQMIVGEAVALVRASAGVLLRWDQASSWLVAVRTHFPIGDAVELPPVSLGEDITGQAAALQRPIVTHDYPSELGPDAPLARAGLRAAAAVPLSDGDRLLGALMVATSDPEARFSPEDVGILEAVAEIATTVLVGIEGDRLLDVSLAARDLAAAVKSELMLPLNTAGLLGEHPDMLPELSTMVDVAVDRLEAAAQHMRELADLVRFQVNTALAEPAPDLGWGPPPQASPGERPAADLAALAPSRRGAGSRGRINEEAETDDP